VCILRNQESACIYDGQKNSLVMNKNAEHCNTHHIILPEAAVSQHSMPLTLRCSFLFFFFFKATFRRSCAAPYHTKFIL